MANGARMEGIDANLFFTFFGMDAISQKRHDHIKAATVGNPGLHLATWLGGLPGMSAIVTHQLEKAMDEPRHPADPRVHRDDLRLRRRPLRLQGVGRHVQAHASEDFIDQVDDIITVGEFYEKAAGGQIIFT